MKRLLVAVAALCGSGLALPALAQAQTAIISGRVTAETGEAIPAVTVTVLALRVGATTDDQGRYSFTIPAERLTSGPIAVLARRIGYGSKTLAITPRVGATTTVNFVHQLAGKVSGMTITGSGTPGASTKITIRGSNSINGDNNPLFVVDGVPVSNDDRGGSFNVGSLSNSASSGLDLGSVINDINPEDIESVSVLKGPNAAALYGSRAANGVIVITTKHGASSNGKLRTALTSTYTWDRPSTYMNWQNLYGQGSAGKF